MRSAGAEALSLPTSTSQKLRGRYVLKKEAPLRLRSTLKAESWFMSIQCAGCKSQKTGNASLTKYLVPALLMSLKFRLTYLLSLQAFGYPSGILEVKRLTRFN